MLKLKDLLVSWKNLVDFPFKGVSPQFMNQVKCCQGLNTLPQSTTYLGVPLFLSMSKIQDF